MMLMARNCTWISLWAGHLPKGFAPGPAGYFYQQATGDSGKGANSRSLS